MLLLLLLLVVRPLGVCCLWIGLHYFVSSSINCSCCCFSLGFLRTWIFIACSSWLFLVLPLFLSSVHRVFDPSTHPLSLSICPLVCTLCLAAAFSLIRLSVSLLLPLSLSHLLTYSRSLYPVHLFFLFFPNLVFW